MHDSNIGGGDRRGRPAGSGRLGAHPDRLLAEAAAAVQSDDDADVLAEAAEILVAERGRVRLADRWQSGAMVQVRTCLGSALSGRVLRSGPDLVIIVDADGAVHALAVTAVHRVSGLPSLLRPEDGRPVMAVTWGSWLRECQVVQARCLDGWQALAEVLAVGVDHVDLAVLADGAGSDAGRGGAECVTVPFHALVQVRDARSGVLGSGPVRRG